MNIENLMLLRKNHEKYGHEDKAICSCGKIHSNELSMSLLASNPQALKYLYNSHPKLQLFIFSILATYTSSINRLKKLNEKYPNKWLTIAIKQSEENKKFIKQLDYIKIKIYGISYLEELSFDNIYIEFLSLSIETAYKIKKNKKNHTYLEQILASKEVDKNKKSIYRPRIKRIMDYLIYLSKAFGDYMVEYKVKTLIKIKKRQIKNKIGNINF